MNETETKCAKLTNIVLYLARLSENRPSSQKDWLLLNWEVLDTRALRRVNKMSKQTVHTNAKVAKMLPTIPDTKLSLIYVELNANTMLAIAARVIPAKICVIPRHSVALE